MHRIWKMRFSTNISLYQDVAIWIIKRILLECHWVKITSKTLYKLKIQNKIQWAQMGKNKNDDMGKRCIKLEVPSISDAVTLDGKVFQTRGHQSSYDTKMVWQGQTLTQITASFLSPRSPHDVTFLPWNANRKPNRSCRMVLLSMILSDLAKYWMTRSIARCLCDSWASCSAPRKHESQICKPDRGCKLKYNERLLVHKNV